MVSCVCVRKVCGCTLPDERELGLCRRERRVAGQPAEHVDDRTLTAHVVRWPKAQRDPVVLAFGESESIGHHADHGVLDVAEPDPLPDDLRVGGESVLPLIPADHHDRQRTLALVPVDQGTSEHRRHAGDSECRSADLGNADGFHRAARCDEIPCDDAIGADIGDGFQLPPRIQVVQHARLRLIGGGVPVLDRHNPIAVLERQGSVDDGIESRGGCPTSDHNGDGESTGEREARIAHEHPEPSFISSHGMTPVITNHARLKFTVPNERRGGAVQSFCVGV